MWQMIWLYDIVLQSIQSKYTIQMIMQVNYKLNHRVKTSPKTESWQGYSNSDEFCTTWRY